MLLQVDVDIGYVLSTLNRIGGQDWKPVFRVLRKPTHKDQRDHRDKQRGPRTRWAPLSATTKKRYAREGKRRNRRILAKLPNARIAIVKTDELIMRSRVRWSNAHQDGPTRVGRGAIVPQRQFMWISSSLIAEARSEFRKALWYRFMGWRYP
jgi:phage gpG-like protein